MSGDSRWGVAQGEARSGVWVSWASQCRLSYTPSKLLSIYFKLSEDKMVLITLLSNNKCETIYNTSRHTQLERNATVCCLSLTCSTGATLSCLHDEQHSLLSCSSSVICCLFNKTCNVGLQSCLRELCLRPEASSSPFWWDSKPEPLTPCIPQRYECSKFHTDFTVWLLHITQP